MTVIDRIYRIGFRVLYLAFRVYTALYKPRMRGTFVFIWVGDRFLAARSSYRTEWSVPGGMAKRNEAWAETARRELEEEVGIALTADELTVVTEMSGFTNPNERVQVFEARMDVEPQFRIDQREIAEARFMTVAEARQLPLLEGVQRYLDSLDK